MTQRQWLEQEIDETILSNENASIMDPMDLLLEMLGQVLGIPGGDVPAFVERRVREIRPEDFDYMPGPRYGGRSFVSEPR